MFKFNQSDLETYAMAAMFDSVAMGFCAECGAEHEEVEPDARGYECQECGEKKVASVLVLLGVI